MSGVAARRGRARSRAGGFTLLEALLALTLVGVALLLDLGLQAQARALDARLAAEADLLRRAEAAIESVRAGVHPLRTGPVDGRLAWPTDAAPTLAMHLVVEPAGVAGLCRVEVRGRLERHLSRRAPGSPGGAASSRLELATLVWRPGAPCR